MYHTLFLFYCTIWHLPPEQQTRSKIRHRHHQRTSRRRLASDTITTRSSHCCCSFASLATKEGRETIHCSEVECKREMAVSLSMNYMELLLINQRLTH